MRPPFVGHRRYSITHRAVQRLRELVPGRDDEDDESLRDKLDEALGNAEDAGKAIRTLDAMLGEPQTLIPIDAFGDVLYAIIKEDTVVTVLPRGHGEEILQRGQAMEQRVAAGQATVRHHDRDKDRWSDGPRRRWQKETGAPVVIERIVRGNGHAQGNGHVEPEPTPAPEPAEPEPERRHPPPSPMRRPSWCGCRSDRRWVPWSRRCTTRSRRGGGARRCSRCERRWPRATARSRCCRFGTRWRSKACRRR